MEMGFWESITFWVAKEFAEIAFLLMLIAALLLLACVSVCLESFKRKWKDK